MAAPARWTLIGLIAGSVFLRVVYFVQIDGGPCSQWHRWEDGDPSFFDAWGRRISEGDWLTREAFHPVHTWHKRVAKEYFIRHRREESDLLEKGLDPARALWDRWYGGTLLHQEPLYPYLVGATYRVLGPDPRWVYALQMVLGVLSNVLVWMIARRHFGERAGLIAAGLVLLCGPLMFYEMTLIRTSLTVFASLALLVLFERAFERGGGARWAAAGAALGAALLLQTTFILFGLAAAALLAWRYRDRAREGGRAAAAVAIGVIACVSPALVRNVAVGAPLLGLSSVGPVTFLAANLPDTDPTRGWSVDAREIARRMTETEGGFGRIVRQTLDSHTPGTFVGLATRKLMMLFRDYELPNNKNFLYYREHAPILGAGFVGFGVILPFALIGLHGAWREAPRHVLLYSLVASAVAPMLIFYVLARFRAPVTAALIPFAAFGLARLGEWILDRRWKTVAIGGGVVALAAAVLFRPLPDHMRRIRSADYRISYRTYGMPREEAAIASSDWSAAASVLEEALRDEPREVRGMEGTPLPEGGMEIRQTTDYFRALHVRRADYLKRAGREEESKREAERAEILHRSLGGVPTAPPAPHD